MMKVHDGEPDDDYIVVQKMVNAYLSETNAPGTVTHCYTGKRNRHRGLCLLP